MNDEIEEIIVNIESLGISRDSLEKIPILKSYFELKDEIFDKNLIISRCLKIMKMVDENVGIQKARDFSGIVEHEFKSLLADLENHIRNK
jgi:hypothetical protein